MKYCYILIFCFFASFSFSQNWDINTLKKINLNASSSKVSFFNNLEHTVSYVNVGTPITLWTLALINKDEKTKANAIKATGAFALNTAITFGMKYAIDRKRPFVTYPYLIQRSSAGSASFPSGHTSSSFATATTLSMSYKKWYVIIPAYTYASLMGYARMVQGVHYPSDVIVGALVGTGSAWLSHQLYKKYIIKKRK